MTIGRRDRAGHRLPDQGYRFTSWEGAYHFAIRELQHYWPGARARVYKHGRQWIAEIA